MIVGEHTRDNDLEVNVLKGKKLTNIRTTSKDEAVRLTPPIRMTLERALAYIQDDELVEVTPESSGCASATSLQRPQEGGAPETGDGARLGSGLRAAPSLLLQSFGCEQLCDPLDTSGLVCANLISWKPMSCISGRQGQRMPRRSPMSMPRLGAAPIAASFPISRLSA